VRLVGRSDPREGRLKVNINGTWGTVCDDHFNDAAAGVVCHMLGYGYSGLFIGNRYGAGSGQILLDNVHCSGREKNIADCQHSGWGIHDCDHSEDVSVSCIEVRLTGSSTPREGRLEVRYNGTWGTVCDNYFNDAAAGVVCYMLGYGYSGSFIDNRYGRGSGQIWLNNVQCNGTETSIAQCQHRDWGQHSCGHYNDVSVSCTGVRLIGSSIPQEGRLEVYYNSTWGTVCDDHFTDAAVRVVCYMLGYGRTGWFIGHRYGRGRGPIWVSNAQCNGMEMNITDCLQSGWGGQRSCYHSEDVSVSCSAVRVRLVGRSDPREGRLEVNKNGTWGTVCDDHFNDAAARVVCYMLGYGYSGLFIGNRYGAGSGQIWLDKVHCSGRETNIADCQHSGWGIHHCYHDEDVSVSCISADSVRLAGSNIPQEGRLEVHYNGTWGTVCNDYFNHAAARVVCHMLGYADTGQYIGNRYGAGSGTIWLDDVACSGIEINIENCPHRDWGRHNCGHHQDVSVSCFNEVRLVGDSRSKGRLEVYYNGTWGTVCNNEFTDAAARVVCYSLGYGHTGRFIGSSYGAGSGQIWLDNVRCHGSESHITECQHGGWDHHNCQHSDDVSISCIADSAEAVALLGGGSPQFGRLEVFHANQWGTVCDDGFTDAAARVVCYSLGFGYVGKMDINHYGAGDGLIWLNSVTCTGTEQHIGKCSQDDWRAHNCTHHQDVAISCISNMSVANEVDSVMSVTPVRLAGGTSSRGRLEVLHHGVWGTVCHNYFTAAAAHVVCKMLGLESGKKMDNSNYMTDHGPIWLDHVRCNGAETDIAKCSHGGWSIHNCEHSEDVAVSCSGTKAEVRLNGGRDPRKGRLEVYHNGTWRSICRDAFSDAAARVVCHMLGFGYIGRPITNTYGYDHGPYWVNSVQCNGTEKNIAKCSNNGWSTGYCTRNEEQAITAITCLTDNAVGLFGGGSPREGRLEIFHNGIWGTVCDDGFTDTTARIICYSLGFGYTGWKTNVGIYGIGNGDIWMDEINCKGMEKHIDECSHRGWGVYNCTHNEDAAVSCTAHSPVTSTMPPTTTEQPTILKYIITGAVILAVILLISFGICIGVTCCRRNHRRSEQNASQMQQRSSNTNQQPRRSEQNAVPMQQRSSNMNQQLQCSEQNAVPMQQMSSNTNRPPPTAPDYPPSVPDYPPPPYSER